MSICVVRLVGVEQRMVSSQSYLHGWCSLDRFGLLWQRRRGMSWAWSHIVVEVVDEDLHVYAYIPGLASSRAQHVHLYRPCHSAAILADRSAFLDGANGGCHLLYVILPICSWNRETNTEKNIVIITLDVRACAGYGVETTAAVSAGSCSSLRCGQPGRPWCRVQVWLPPGRQGAVVTVVLRVSCLERLLGTHRRHCWQTRLLHGSRRQMERNPQVARRDALESRSHAMAIAPCWPRPVACSRWTRAASLQRCSSIGVDDRLLLSPRHLIWIALVDRQAVRHLFAPSAAPYGGCPVCYLDADLIYIGSS